MLAENSQKNGPEENLPFGLFLLFSGRIAEMRNVFVEKWPSVVKFLLVAGVVMFVMIRWA
jgi:hypothetical protein